MKIKYLSKKELHWFQINVVDIDWEEIDWHFIQSGALDLMKNYFWEKEVVYEDWDEDWDVFCKIEIDFNSFSSYIRAIKEWWFYLDYIEYLQNAKKQQIQPIWLIDYLYNHFNKNWNTFNLFQYIEK